MQYTYVWSPRSLLVIEGIQEFDYSSNTAFVIQQLALRCMDRCPSPANCVSWASQLAVVDLSARARAADKAEYLTWLDSRKSSMCVYRGELGGSVGRRILAVHSATTMYGCLAERTEAHHYNNTDSRSNHLRLSTLSMPLISVAIAGVASLVSAQVGGIWSSAGAQFCRSWRRKPASALC
jgi:hypothetical protein